MATTLHSNVLSSPRKREKIAWLLVLIQSCVIFLFISPSSVCDDDGRGGADRRRLDAGRKGAVGSPGMNKRSNEYYERKRRGAGAKEAAYEPPEVHDATDAHFVSRIWRSNGSPSINSDLKSGTCWCSADDWCMCTPSLAIDLILRSGDEHIWVVRRSDTGLLALMGGFTEVGETSEESVHRELLEEMGLRLDAAPVLFGVYNDPRRDARRHTTSVVYIASVPATVTPKAGDDATHVVRLPVADINKHDYFADHKTILHDYLAIVEKKKYDQGTPQELDTNENDSELKRSVCPM